MDTSKSIARALITALSRGEDPARLAEMIKKAFLGTAREPQLQNVLFYLEKFSEAAEARDVCRIESAEELSDEAVTRIKEIFGAERAQTLINKSLVGGFRAESGGLFYDGSVQSRLTSLKEALV